MLQHTAVPVTPPPSYMLPHPSRWSQFRDVVNTIAVIGGITYGLYLLYKVYVSFVMFKFVILRSAGAMPCLIMVLFMYFTNFKCSLTSNILYLNQVLILLYILSEIYRTILIWHKRETEDH